MTRLVATTLDPGAVLVRFHPDNGPRYDRMIVVTPEDDGRVLHLMGWIGPNKDKDDESPPISHSEWRRAQRTLFPKAREVRWERMTERGLIARRLGLSLRGNRTSIVSE